ncbi:hypothetical protein NPS01_42210 [Nocardioides psychrotolerans]|nr:hypothetical protein NPS01_42210 [Nocardioides psychrotolerans]
MTSWTRGAAAPTVAPAMGVAFLVTALVIDLVGDVQLTGVYATSAVLASISCRPRRTAAVAGLGVSATLFSGLWHGTLAEPGWSLRLASCAGAGVVSVGADLPRGATGPGSVFATPRRCCRSSTGSPGTRPR